MIEMATEKVAVLIANPTPVNVKAEIKKIKETVKRIEKRSK
jgi:hypothetical protein